MIPKKSPHQIDYKQAIEHCSWIASRQGDGFFVLRILATKPDGSKRVIDANFFDNRSPALDFELRQFLKKFAIGAYHIFYSVNAFAIASALAKHAVPGRLLHVDADQVSLPPPGPQPTRIVESSPGNYHFLYELTDPVAPTEAARLNKALQQQVEGDKGGHSPAKLLRLPGTLNVKYQ